jgi:hypothetical protein
MDCNHELKRKADGTKYCPLSLRVYDYQWKPTECPIDLTLVTYKYLNVHLRLCCKNSDAFEREKAKADMLLHLLTQTCTLQAKIDCIQFKIMPIILYTAQVSNWSLKQDRSLNVPFTRTYRKLLSLPKQSPEAIIYLPNKYFGIGLSKVLDLAQKYKWSNLRRYQAFSHLQDVDA